MCSFTLGRNEKCERIFIDLVSMVTHYLLNDGATRKLEGGSLTDYLSDLERTILHQRC